LVAVALALVLPYMAEAEVEGFLGVGPYLVQLVLLVQAGLVIMLVIILVMEW
jgi:hypothetical protein